MQIESDNYTWTLIHEMAQIDLLVNRSMSSELHESQELINSEIIEASKKFMEVINGVMEAPNESMAIESQDLNTLADCYFIWSLVHMFYIDKNNSIAEDFARLYGKTLPKPQMFEDYLIQADFGAFVAKVKTYGTKIVIDDVQERQRLINTLNSIQELIGNRTHFFKPIYLYETRALQRSTFKKVFESQKDRFKAILNDLQNFSNKDDINMQSLIKSVKLLSGDVELIQTEYLRSDMQLFSAYLLFVDPLLDGNLVRQFLNATSSLSNSRINSSNKGADKQINSQSKDDSMSSVNDPSDDELFDNCSDLIKGIIVKLLLNPENGYIVAETLLKSTPKWFAFHIIKLLIANNVIKQGSLDNGHTFDYFHTLVDGYLKYLINENCTFKIFKAYYVQYYNFNDNIKIDYLLRIVFININDSDMLTYLNHHNCAYIVEKAVCHFINAEKCQALHTDTLISLLNYTNEESVAGKLYEILFNIQLHLIRKDDENYRKELERLITHANICLEVNSNPNSWRIILIKDLLSYKLRILNRESLDLLFISQLLSDLDKSMDVDMILSFELIDCVNDTFKVTKASFDLLSLDFDAVNSLMRNLQLCRIKQGAFKKQGRYFNLMNEAENTVMTSVYGI